MPWRGFHHQPPQSPPTGDRRRRARHGRLACEPSQLPCASCVRPQPQALRTGAGAGLACEPSQKPPASFVLPQPQRLRAGAGEEGTWDMVWKSRNRKPRFHRRKRFQAAGHRPYHSLRILRGLTATPWLAAKWRVTHKGGVGTGRPGSAGRRRTAFICVDSWPSVVAPLAELFGSDPERRFGYGKTALGDLSLKTPANSRTAFGDLGSESSEAGGLGYTTRPSPVLPLGDSCASSRPIRG